MSALQGELGRCDPWLNYCFQGMRNNGEWSMMATHWLPQLVAISLLGCPGDGAGGAAFSWEATDD